MKEGGKGATESEGAMEISPLSSLHAAWNDDGRVLRTHEERVRRIGPQVNCDSILSGNFGHEICDFTP